VKGEGRFALWMRLALYCQEAQLAEIVSSSFLFPSAEILGRCRYSRPSAHEPRVIDDAGAATRYGGRDLPAVKPQL